MATRYQIRDELVPLDEGCAPDPSYPIVEVLTEEEFKELGESIDDFVRESIAELLMAESCYVDVHPNYLIGSMAVPDKVDLMGDRDLFSFYYETDRLIFVDDSDVALEAMNRVARTCMRSDMSTAVCLYLFLRELIINDTRWLGELEDKMEDAEEAMVNSDEELPTDDLAMYRRVTIRMSTYYQQLAAVALILSSNEYGLMTDDEARNFEYVIRSADRLESRAETIREYSLTLRELHQTQIDVRQNNTMQLLTLVTVLIAPLTLIAGWYGMNFSNIPGVAEPWGFPVICVVGIVITLVLVWWFHRKRWI